MNLLNKRNTFLKLLSCQLLSIVCPLIWMYCNKTANSLINNIHKRTLRPVHQMEDEDFDDL